ncbi:cation:proton antiporter [Marinobacterium marinum]|uniref:Sodium:proton antiporter n=1 Tax=Marinobacterium marinum TaxID=2756129 RepID=A0A7W1X0P3_9GAMM|nr:sodium:proton antiporter [Marinobacterium marinum]MBA4503709.1 sodium:proton antiporter [Marinobacterium marinum]
MTLNDLFSPTLGFASLALASLACQWLAWRWRLPAILFLLLTGILLGPIGGLLSPDDFLDELLFPLVSISVALILFEGSLTLKFSELRETGPVVRRLVTWGALITWLVISLAAYGLIGLSPPLAALFGALVVVTGPTVIVPMLRTLRATPRIAEVLRWEGILIDPLGALLAVLVFQWLIATGNGDNGLFASLLVFMKVTLVGTGAGLLAGWLLSSALRRHWVPEYLEVLATVSLVLVTFALSNQLAHESGLLAVTLMGIWLANARGINIEGILAFKEHLAVLLISGLFILLAARLDLTALLALGWPALALLAVIQFIARPLSVWVSTLGSRLSWQERSLIAWIGPRGIVAAAVSALFAIKLEQAGYEGAGLISALTFAVIIGTVVFQSATARPIAKLLGVTEPEPRGLLLIGANPAARALAECLQKEEIPLLMVDTHWDAIRDARMHGIRTLCGNPLATVIDDRLDLAGLGHLLTLTPQREWNALLCQHFQRDFPAHHIFSVRTDQHQKARLKLAEEHQGQRLGPETLSFSTLAGLISRGARFRATRFSDNFSYTHWQAQDADNTRIPIALISPDRHLTLLSDAENLAPETGWTLVYLAPNAVTEKRD